MSFSMSVEDYESAMQATNSIGLLQSSYEVVSSDAPHIRISPANRQHVKTYDRRFDVRKNCNHICSGTVL